MTYQQTIEYLYAQLPMFSRIGEKAIKKDLDNTFALCAYLGDPQHKFRSIHIAGTNGKGSVSHGLAAIFQAAGYRTGLYTSPHLKDFRERIKINGVPCPESFVIDLTARLHDQIEIIQPSFFEVTVAMAFEYFAQEQVDIAIIETGLGGRMDSTNIITPQVSVITNISLDHQNILGDTLEQIAFEKAGIIKAGVPVVIGRKAEATNTVFINKSLQERSPLSFAEDLVQIGSFRVEPAHIELRCRVGEEDLEIVSDLRSLYQVENIRTVLAAVAVYNRQYPGALPREAIVDGLRRVILATHFEGRWQLLREHPRVIADVGHNVDGLRKSLMQLRYENYANLHIVYGAVKDKDVRQMLALLPRDAQYYFTEPPMPRKLAVADLQQLAADAGLTGQAYNDPQSALTAALQRAEDRDLVLVTGSFFVVAEVI